MLQFEVPDQYVTTVAFSPDGRQLVAAGAVARVDVFELPGGGQTTVPLAVGGGTLAPRFGGFILGGDYIALLSTNGEVVFVNAKRRATPTATYHADYPTTSAWAFAPGGVGAAAAGAMGIRVDWFRRPYAGAKESDLRRPRFTHRAAGQIMTRAVAFHPRGQRLLVARAAVGDPTARLDWLNMTTRLFAPAATGPVPASLLAIAPDGGRYAAAGESAVRVWTAANEPTPERVFEGAADPAALAWHPGGRVLAVGGGDGVVRLLSADTLAEAAAYDFGAGAVLSLAFAPDGLTAAAGTGRGRVVVWDVDV